MIWHIQYLRNETFPKEIFTGFRTEGRSKERPKRKIGNSGNNVKKFRILYGVMDGNDFGTVIIISTLVHN